jgi:plasmid replication initiation protein
MDASKELVVRQSNHLIEASYKMASIGEIRLVRMLIAQIQPSDEDFKVYRINVSDFASLFGLSSSNKSVYDLLYEASDALTSRKIRLKSDNRWLLMNWLSSAEYRKGDGYVELCFDKKLKPYLLELKGYYTQYQINSISRFRSLYSIRLYELLKMEQFKLSKSGKFNRTFEYQDLRERLGISEKEYKYFKDFRVNVIEVAAREINSNPDINITDIHYDKIGARYVTHIIFECELAKQTQLDLEETEPKLQEVKNEITKEIEDLIGLGIAESTALKWRKKYGVERIKRNIEYTIAKQKLGKVRDSAGYLSRAIADDSASGWAVSEAKKQEEAKKQKVQAIESKTATERSEQATKELNEKLWVEFKAMPETERARIIEAVKNKSQTMKTQYIKHGEDGALFRSNIIVLLKTENGQ